VAKFAKSETLQDSLDSYKRGIAEGGSKRSAAYELAIKSGRDYRAGDQVSFYVTGAKKNVSVVDNSCLLKDAPASQAARNENTLYYLAKLDELYKKFSPFIPKSKNDDELGLGL
ncbi:MAG: DNA polymerase II, partial [Lentisphaerae bacterium]|nr:DNA polymerase II [Lentisphaerota bacterium]